jgi:hypothetical protein
MNALCPRSRWYAAEGIGQKSTPPALSSSGAACRHRWDDGAIGPDDALVLFVRGELFPFDAVDIVLLGEAWGGIVFEAEMPELTGEGG